MHGAARPGSAKVGDDAAGVQEVRDFPLRSALLDEGAIDPPDRLRLLGRAGHKHHAVGLDALVLASCELALGCTTRSEEHTSELQSLMRISYAVFCLKKKKKTYRHNTKHTYQPVTNRKQIQN